MDDRTRITQRLEETVGHAVSLETGPGDLLSPNHTMEVWRVMPVDAFSVHEFITWHQRCNRQWYETVEKAAGQYSAHWKEWTESADKSSQEVKHTDDGIDFP